MRRETSERTLVSGDRSRRAARLAWPLAALSLLLCIAAIALHVVTLPLQPPSPWGTGGLSAVLYVYLPFLAFPLVGALIASRRPANPVGWLCLAVGIVWMFATMSGSYATYGLVLAPPGSVPFPAAVGTIGASLAPATAGLFGTYLLLLFPDGRLPSRRWRPLALLSGAVIAGIIVGGLLAPGRVEGLSGVRNPFGLEGYPWIADASQWIVVLLPLCILASVLSLVVRYLRAGEEEREQIKWLAFAASVLVSGFGFFVILGSFLPEASPEGGSLLGNLVENAVTLSFAGVPVAIGFAVLKYRLYDIDVVINRTLVYGALTVTLVATYFGGVVVLQRVFVALTGERTALAIVVSTLAIAALFSPARRRIQSFIDRRFYRRRYDARKTLEAFAARLRERTDLEALGDELLGVVGETMQPARVSLWLRPDPARRDRGEPIH